MRKHQWRTCADIGDMLHSLRSLRVSVRKLRLFACACCRRIDELMPDERCRAAVAVAEQFAEGAVSREALTAANRDAFDLIAQCERAHGRFVAYYAAHACICATTPMASDSASAWYGAASARQIQRMITAGEPLPVLPAAPVMWPAALGETRVLAEMLRDVFGNPFRRPRFTSAWLTSDVLALARGIYDERAFDRMPILADALQDAGCNYDLVLNHCRDTSLTHVRGCWVVDALLGKE